MSCLLLSLGLLVYRLGGDLVSSLTCQETSVRNQSLVDLEDAYDYWADTYFCRECQCASITPQTWAQAGWNTTALMKGRAFNGTATSLTGCGESLANPALNFLQYLETTYACSGVCETKPFFLFRDIRE